ncbi:DNA polymerase III subunit delta' [sulfur-oxidizing endosymbiont of Gigantopelta aegis]|uniref:DNA polymerase III subunit delta' n=1 Tax=sulfur-oxidizing endosymbiont of Gigantopelta aegis TaxID=2794934 RepID=UPI0018DC6B68|nr:DNA polymerase III subunit delta' [sulfur-oxidizing endosymbiont of Gigantopelta aegis]
MNTSYYPWQKTIWQKIYVKPLESEHFPHALLLAGVSGIGKKVLANTLARGLLCRSPQVNPQSGLLEPCQINSSAEVHANNHCCRACQLFTAGNHPDFNYITTPEDKKVIPVDAIRDLIQWSVMSSQMEGRKVIIIEPAESMNVNAANSLLKTLEEPVANTIIILLSNKKQALLPTIRSRCQTIDLPLPETQQAVQWLQGNLPDTIENSTPRDANLLLSLAAGAPLLALHLAQSTQLDSRQQIVNDLLSIIIASTDPVAIAESLFKLTKLKATKMPKVKASKLNSSKLKPSKNKQLPIMAYDVIYWLDAIVSDIARLAHGCELSLITNTDLEDKMTLISTQLSIKKLLKLSDAINKAYYEIQGQININLLFEKLLIDWKNCKI